MGKQITTPLARAARLLDLVPYLTAHQGIAIGELAHEFDVSESEMMADLNTLWMCGLPGYTPLELIELSFDSGFVTIGNAETLDRTRSLSHDEIVVLLLGLDILRGTLLDNRPDLVATITQLIQSLQSIVGRIVSASAQVNSKFRSEILVALTGRRLLAMTYHSSARDEITEREVLPLEITTNDGVEYLVAYCHHAQAFRTFRLDRIIELKVLDQVGQSVAIYDAISTEQVSAWVIAHKARRVHLERFLLDPIAVASAIGATHEISSFSDQWIIRSIVATGGDFELVAPSEIRLSIASKAKALLACYGVSLA